MNDEQAREYYTLVGEIVGRSPYIDEAFAAELAWLAIHAGITEDQP
jgi:hypothetical protein